ncbi:MAG: alanine racemase, partial [Aggregatilineales bacterium]
ALLVGEHYHILMDDGLNALKNLPALPGRMVTLDGLNHSIIVDDSYRANAASTLSAIDWLEEVRLENQRLIFVLGDMDDMGKNSQVGHRLVGTRMAKTVDYVVTQGTEAAFAARAALDEGLSERDIHVSYSSSDTMAFLETLNLNENDVIFIKGGAATQMEQLVRKLLSQPDDNNVLVRQSTPAYMPENANRPLYSSWIEIDTAVAGQNFQRIKQQLPHNVQTMAVVKADAYGHGAVMVARTVLANGADYLGVASISEALELRDAGIDAPILVMSYLPVDALRQAMTQNITASIYDLQQAQLYDRSARYLKGTLKYHTKLDTGMGRLGVLVDDAVTVFRHLSAMTNLELEGIYTHFSAADNDPDHTEQQLKSFKYTVRLLRAAGFKFRYIHAANSAGTLRSNDYYFNLVRPGVMLYGLSPDSTLSLPDGVAPVLTWKSSVLQVKTFPPDYPIGYGNTYRTKGKERIAILPIGYADGLRRSADDSNYRWREVLIHGQRAPIVGRISMEKTAVNVSHIPEVNIGDEVVLIGKQGNQEITATDIAGWLNTINYEVVTALSSRIPRILKYS